MANERKESGPLGLNWTYLRPYGSGDRYSVDLYREGDHTDQMHFVKTAEGIPEYVTESKRTLDFDREGLDKLIAELTWLKKHWGEVGRG